MDDLRLSNAPADVCMRATLATRVHKGCRITNSADMFRFIGWQHACVTLLSNGVTSELAQDCLGNCSRRDPTFRLLLPPFFLPLVGSQPRVVDSGCRCRLAPLVSGNVGASLQSDVFSKISGGVAKPQVGDRVATWKHRTAKPKQPAPTKLI